MTEPRRESTLRYILRTLALGLIVGILFFIVHVLLEMI